MNCLKSLCIRHFKDYLKCFTSRHLSIEAQNQKELDIFDRKFEEIDVNSFADLMVDNTSDKNIKNKIENILNEYEYEKQSSLKVPTTLTKDQMKELLELSQTFERIKLFHFLYGIETKKFRRNAEKILKSVPKQQTKRPIGIWDESRTELVYGFRHNSLLQRIDRPSVNRQYINRLRTTALFGPKLVIDLDFDKYMKRYESRRLLQQLAFLYNYNKYETKEPFDLHFVNCNEEEISIQEMSRYIPKFNCSDFLVTMHYNKSYLDVFPKESLVYLSPHSDETLTSVSEDDIYIIGGIVDKSYREPITAIKAREDGIRTAKLPIDSHLKWIKGTKHLCINQVLAILHDWKVTNDWELTFKKILPSRKIYTEEEIEAINFSKTSKYV